MKPKFKPTNTPKPGPWGLHPHRASLILDAEGVIVAEALHMAGYAEPARSDIKKTAHHFHHPGEVYKGANIAMANARLISCAPEMLDMLKRIIEGMEPHQYVDNTAISYDDLKKLITKAQGS